MLRSLDHIRQLPMDRPERTVNLITDTNALTEFGKAVERVLLGRLVDADSLPHIPQKDVLTNREAMEYLGLSRPTLVRLRRDGRLPYYKVGNSVFYLFDDINAMIMRGKVIRPDEKGDPLNNNRSE